MQKLELPLALRAADRSQGAVHRQATLTLSRLFEGGACALSNREQTLAEGRAANAPFERVNERKNSPIEKKYLPGFKMALFQQAKIQPPGEVADEIEIREPRNFEAGSLQQMPELGSPVTAEV